MMIPRAAPHAYETHARLDQTTGKQTALAGCRTAVALAQGFRLGGDVESFSRLLGADQRERGFVVRAHRVDDMSGVELPKIAVSDAQQRVAALHARPVDPHR